MAAYSVLLSLLFVALVPLLHLLIKTKRKRGGNQYKLPPGPKKLPIIGNLHQVGSLPHQSLWLLSREHGPLMHLQLGRIPTLVVSSSEMAREVLTTHDLNFCTRPRLTSFSKYSYNGSDISFSPYGEYWRELRKICILELFSMKRVESFRSIREEEVSLMIQSLASFSQTPTDMRKAMTSLLNNIVCRVAFGKNYEKSEIHRILEEVQALFAGFFVGDYFPKLGWIDKLTGIEGRLEKSARELDEFYEEVINYHLDTDQRIREEHEDIVDVLLRIQKESTHLTDNNIKAVLMNILIAGIDTSTTTIVWAMAELIRNSSLMSKAQEEVRVLLKSKGKVEENDLGQLQYLKAVVKETFRLHTPVPLLLPREAMQHCKIGEYDILPNTRVFINAWGIARDPKTWENAEDFIPERFLNSSADFKGHDFEFIPFGSGRRICPAMSTGVVTVELALANLLYSFDWELQIWLQPADLDLPESVLGVLASDPFDQLDKIRSPPLPSPPASPSSIESQSPLALIEIY